MGLLDGLMGDQSLGGGALTPEQQRAVNQRGLLGFLAGMAPYMGYSRLPQSFSQALAAGAGGMGAAQDAGMLNMLRAQQLGYTGQLTKAQVDALNAEQGVASKLFTGDGGPRQAAPQAAPSAAAEGGVGEGAGLGGGSPEAAASLVKKYESNGGDYNVGFGGTDLSKAPRDQNGFPIWEGKMGPAGISHAAGAYQFEPATWAQYAGPLGIHDFSKESQDAVFRAAYLDQGLKPWAPYNPKIRQALRTEGNLTAQVPEGSEPPQVRFAQAAPLTATDATGAPPSGLLPNIQPAPQSAAPRQATPDELQRLRGRFGEDNATYQAIVQRGLPPGSSVNSKGELYNGTMSPQERTNDAASYSYIKSNPTSWLLPSAAAAPAGAPSAPGASLLPPPASMPPTASAAPPTGLLAQGQPQPEQTLVPPPPATPGGINPNAAQALAYLRTMRGAAVPDFINRAASFPFVGPEAEAKARGEYAGPGADVNLQGKLAAVRADAQLRYGDTAAGLLRAAGMYPEGSQERRMLQDAAANKAGIKPVLGGERPGVPLRQYNSATGRYEVTGQNPQVGQGQVYTPQGTIENVPGSVESSSAAAAGKTFATGYSTGMAKEALDVIAGGNKAADDYQQVQLLRGLLSGIKTGKLTTAHATMGSWLQASGLNPAVIGVDPKTPASVEAAQAIINKFALSGIGAANGGIPVNNFSEADRNFMVKTVPSIANRPEANELLLTVKERLSQLGMQRADEWSAAKDRGMSYEQFDREWRAKLGKMNIFGDLAKAVGPGKSGVTNSGVKWSIQ